MDERLRQLFSEVVGAEGSAGLALVALGGYGRRALCLHSDVDLLLLHQNRQRRRLTDLTQAMFYPLWDAGFEVGHAVRTVSQCLDIGANDLQVMMSMVDARFLAGDESLFTSLWTKLRQRHRSAGRRREFFDKVLTSFKKRRETYGGSPYLLEPHVKEGEGGLRDIHAVNWIGRICFDSPETADLVKAGLMPPEAEDALDTSRDFLWRVRNHLHYLAGDHQDRLNFEVQPTVAEFFGFTDRGAMNAVEAFMRAYHRHVFAVAWIVDAFIDRAELELRPPGRSKSRGPAPPEGFVIEAGRLDFADPGQVPRRPSRMMEIFALAAERDLPVAVTALQTIRDNLHLVDDDFRTATETTDCFWRFMRADWSSPDLLRAMHGVGLLPLFLPEMEPTVARSLHDAYHVYTVDVHLIQTVWILKQMAQGRADRERGGRFNDLFEDLDRPEVLFLAGLIHDVGKGLGPGHAARGASLVWTLGSRLGLSGDDTEAVKFLVAEHLLLTDVATSRDMSDEKLVIQTARRVKHTEWLTMLVLLSVADSLATGPEAYSPWKAMLLQELYVKVRHILEHSDLASPLVLNHVAEMPGQVAAILADEFSPEDIDRFLEPMSDHYLAAVSPETVAEHIRVESRLKKGDLIFTWRERPRRDACEVTIFTHDRPGLFSQMAGVLSLHDINILEAQVFTRTNGVALEVFHVDYPLDRAYLDEKWDRVAADAQRVVKGRLSLEYRLATKERPRRTGRPETPRRPPRVGVDHETSDFYTLIEVTAHDRLGLLYDITRILFGLQVSVHIAKVSTRVDQVHDVFYVVDFFGQKLDDPEQSAEIEAALSYMLAEKQG
jgi:[protein-PII] uridylyltransferase